MSYVFTIAIGTVICMGLGLSIYPILGYPYWWGFFAPVITIALILISALCAIIIRRFPEKWFNNDRKFFNARKYEKGLLKFLRVKKWKDDIPELGGFTDFHKDKIYEPDNPAYFERFILECNYGSTIHFISAILGYVVIFITPIETCYLMAIPLGTINFVLNILPYFVLRYNVGRLKVALKFLNKSKKVQNTNTNEA